MEFLVEWAFGALIVVVGPLLTLLDLPGNTIMLAAGIGYAFFDEARYFDDVFYRRWCWFMLLVRSGNLSYRFLEFGGIKYRGVRYF